MRQHIEATTGLLEAQLRQIDAQIELIIAQDAQLCRNRELLLSIPVSAPNVEARPQRPA